MIIGIIEMVLKLFVSGLSTYLERQALSEQAKKDYITFVEIMERQGLASVKMRLSAKDQVDRVRKLWEEDGK